MMSNFSTPELNLPENMDVEELGESCVILHGHGHTPFQDAAWGPLLIPGVTRFMALSHHNHFVTSPSFGTRLANVPDRCQFLLWEENHRYGVLLPLLHEDFRSEAVGTCGGLQLQCSCAQAGRARNDVVVALACLRDDPYQAISDGLRMAVQWMKRGRLRTEKATPEWIDYLGWCTWDAFYSEVTESKILDGLVKFREGGIIPGQMIIDDGWQHINSRNYLLSYGVKNGTFSENRLRTVVRRAKDEFGLSQVGCWRTLFGHLRGVDTQSPDLAPLKRRLVLEPNTPGDTFGVVEPEDVPQFHDAYAARIAADGIDFVKVDFQSALHLMTHEQCGRAEAARIWQQGLQASVQKYFHGRMLNCMAMGSEEVYHTTISNVCRSSDDFYPGKDESHPHHLRLNAYNALWLGPLEWPDWDMFQSGHPWAMYHGIARAICGGPVYVSDKPGTSDFALLKRFVAADGRLLRCPQPAQPTRDILFKDPLTEHLLLKVFNRCGAIGLLGVFHPDPDAGSAAISESIGAWLVEGLAAERYAVHSLERGFLGIFSHQQEIVLSLQPRHADLLMFSPVVDGFAPLGLLEKLNSAAALISTAASNSRLTLDVRGGGPCSVYAEKPVREVRMDGQPTPFQCKEHLVTVDTGTRPRCRIELVCMG